MLSMKRSLTRWTGTLTSLLLKKCQRERCRSVTEADRERSFARRFSKGPAPPLFRFALCWGMILYSSDLASGIPRHLSVELIQVNERETANVRCSRRCRNEANFSPFFIFFLSLSSFKRTVDVSPGSAKHDGFSTKRGDCQWVGGRYHRKGWRDGGEAEGRRQGGGPN